MFFYGRLSFLLIQFQPVSLSYLPELLYHQIFGVGKPTPTPGTKIFIDVPFDGAGFKLFGGVSGGRSVAVEPNCGFPVFTCFVADTSTCWMFCASFLSISRLCIHSSTLRFVFSLLSVSFCSRSTSRSGTYFMQPRSGYGILRVVYWWTESLLPLAV